jgi:ubiquinone/menaquinone biosynthesis C-methylase UbiE
MTDHFVHIYTHCAANYHRFIAVEDVDGNLLNAIEGMTKVDGKRILDLGTGTGRFPLLLARRASQLIGLDLHWDMLRQNQAQRRTAGGHWELTQGDMRELPFPSGWADIVIAGWAIGHLRGWFADDWRTQIGRVLREMHRVCASNGTLVIFETLTTGSTAPAPPTKELAEYYAWLENEGGFIRHAISTDYQFENVEQAVAWTEFFFGKDLAKKIREQQWARLPEWTGMWVKTP